MWIQFHHTYQVILQLMGVQPVPTALDSAMPSLESRQSAENPTRSRLQALRLCHESPEVLRFLEGPKSAAERLRCRRLSRCQTAYSLEIVQFSAVRLVCGMRRTAWSRAWPMLLLSFGEAVAEQGKQTNGQRLDHCTV